MALKVLLVEDDHSVRETLCEALCGVGHEVTCVGRFEEGDREIAKGDYDLLITDVRLPGGSGANLAQKARSLGGSAVLITGYGDVRETLERSKIPHLAKPFRLRELFAAIERIFPRSTGAAEEPA
jgi:DNA-binding response OmpR family regulator